jgi:hypothetical protein
MSHTILEGFESKVKMLYGVHYYMNASDIHPDLRVYLNVNHMY